MPSYSTLSPVSVAVYSTLNVAALTALAPGGVRDDVPQGVTFPFVFFEVREDDISGFGASPHFGDVELRIHAYSTQGSMKEAQDIIAKVNELLRNTTLTISGFNHAGKVAWLRTIPLQDELINGVKCHEMVSVFRIYAESTT
jgi:hypothetical protein